MLSWSVNVQVSVVSPKSVSSVGTVMLAVWVVLAFAENTATSAPFFWIVSLPSFTVGIVGLSLKSLYEPDVATVARVGLLLKSS